MKINIYYGGRGLLDDPTLYVLNKMEEVLKELRVTVERINIYEHKNEIATLPQTMKDADGIILATTVEWLGIGGYMQQFLDACWLYGLKDNMKEGAGSHVAGLEYADASWDPSRWSAFDNSKYDANVTGDGLYTVWMETGGAIKREVCGKICSL